MIQLLNRVFVYHSRNTGMLLSYWNQNEDDICKNINICKALHNGFLIIPFPSESGFPYQPI